MGREAHLQRLAHGRSCDTDPDWSSSPLKDNYTCESRDPDIYRCTDRNNHRSYMLLFDQRGRPCNPGAVDLEEHLAQAQNSITNCSLGRDLSPADEEIRSSHTESTSPSLVSLVQSQQVTTLLSFTGVTFHCYIWDSVLARVLLFPSFRNLSFTQILGLDFKRRYFLPSLLSQTFWGYISICAVTQLGQRCDRYFLQSLHLPLTQRGSFWRKFKSLNWIHAIPRLPLLILVCSPLMPVIWFQTVHALRQCYTLGTRLSFQRLIMHTSYMDMLRICQSMGLATVYAATRRALARRFSQFTLAVTESFTRSRARQQRTQQTQAEPISDATNEPPTSNPLSANQPWYHWFLLLQRTGSKEDSKERHKSILIANSVAIFTDDRSSQACRTLADNFGTLCARVVLLPVQALVLHHVASTVAVLLSGLGFSKAAHMITQQVAFRPPAPNMAGSNSRSLSNSSLTGVVGKVGIAFAASLLWPTRYY